MNPLEMSPLEILAAAGLISIAGVAAYIVMADRKIGSAAIAAALCAAFLTYSGVTLYSEGLLLVWTNHTQNMWGVQVWWDLLFAVGIALFFIAPRARAVGMNVPLWTLAILATASIALLAMAARLFWLESQAETSTA